MLLNIESAKAGFLLFRLSPEEGLSYSPEDEDHRYSDQIWPDFTHREKKLIDTHCERII